MSKRYKEDSRSARDRVYADKGRGACPYEAGTRIARLWEKWRKHFWSMEEQFDDLAEAYGEFRPDHLNQSERGE